MESFNNYLKYLMPSKPNFYKFVNIIRKEENVSYLEYNNIEEGNWNKKKKILNKTEKINNLIEKYKNMGSVLIKNKSNRNDIINLLYECLKQLNTLDHNPNFNY